LGLLKYSKSLLYVFFAVMIGIGIFLYVLSDSYFVSLPITYNKDNHPVIDVKIGNRTFAVDVSVGSKHSLFLSKESLDYIKKQPQGSSEWHDLTGGRYESPSYLIPKMKIENLTVKDVVAIQSYENKDDKLGKYLGGEFNLFLDFPHSRIIACDSFSRLKAKKFVTDQWSQVPFETNCMGIIFQVETDVGTYKFSLCTTCTTSALSSSITQLEEILTTTKFCIGEREFRTTSLDSLELPDMVHEIDGFIGMDFLKKHAVYLDYSNKIAYFEPETFYFEKIPVSVGNCSIPNIDICIEGINYSLEVDLGGGFLLSLSADLLSNIHKTHYGTSSWIDFKGNKYSAPSYILPEVKIEELIFSDAFVSEDREDFHENVIFNASPLKGIGSIGRLILEKYNFFLDFGNSAIYACNSYKSLQEKELLSRNLLTIPFVLHPDGIMLSVETDTGFLDLLLDTGTSCTAIRVPHPDFTSKFCLMDHDFGARSIFPLELHSSFNYDGFLGMDFLKEYSLYIDYPNKLIYLDLQKGERDE